MLSIMGCRGKLSIMGFPLFQDVGAAMVDRGKIKSRNIAWVYTGERKL